MQYDSIVVLGRDTVHVGAVAGPVNFCLKIAGTNRTVVLKVLVGCSGSMAGSSIEAARRALDAILTQMSGGDRFSLSRFGSTVEH